MVVKPRSPAPPDPEFSEWRALRIAEQEVILARHSPGGGDSCEGCAAVGGNYPGWSSAWPCGKYREAQRLIDMLSGRTPERA